MVRSSHVFGRQSSLDSGVFRSRSISPRETPCREQPITAAHGVCHHAASRGQKVRLLPKGGANAPNC